MAKKPASVKAFAIDTKVKPKRDMFSELMEGMEALKAQRLGQRMLPSHVGKACSTPGT